VLKFKRKFRRLKVNIKLIISRDNNLHYLDHPVCSKEAFLKTRDLKASLFTKDAKIKNMVTTVVQTVVYILRLPVFS